MATCIRWRFRHTLLFYPLVGLLFGWLFYRHPHARGWVRPPGFFSVEPLPPDEAEACRRRTRRSIGIGFGVGIALALAGAALDFIWRGWPFLGWTLIFGLVAYPFMGMCLGYNLSLRPGDPKPTVGNLQFRTQGLMILVAYVALLFGLGTQATRYGMLASQYQQKALIARSVVDALQLHAELEGKSTEAYKRDRYGRSADGEDFQARLATQYLARRQRLVEYHTRLAAKYARAARRPWVPVAPDPPPPQ
jgi:hypothetical protein